MMNLQRVGVLAACEGLDDFPTFLVGEDATGLLACWTAAWRPGLLAATGQLPDIVSAFAPPPAADWSTGLLFVPTATPDDCIEWLEAVRALEGPSGGIIEGLVDRPTIIASIDQRVPTLPQAGDSRDREFFALAYAYLQVSALTHELLGGPVFDPAQFSQAAVAAARAAVANDDEAMNAELRRCYDQLEQTRDHSYPATLALIDVTLVAETTLGGVLRDELTTATATNLLLPGSLANMLASDQPETADALRQAVGDRRACVMTGIDSGADPSLLPPEAMLRELDRGAEAVTGVAGQPPTFFAQHATSAPPRLPQLLVDKGFQGALLVGFDGAEPLPLDQGRTTWVGLDGTSLDAVVAVPRDLARPETLLGLNEHLAYTLQQDHVATVVLAGWPGHRHPAFEDLRLVTKRSDVLGRFVTLADYFEQAAESDHWSTVGNDALGPDRRGLARCELPSIEGQHDQLAAGMASLSLRMAGVVEPAADQPLTETLLRSIGAKPDEKGGTTVSFNAWGSPVLAQGCEVPAVGFRVASQPVIIEAPPRAGGETLLSERLEATVQAATGGLRSLRTHQSRRNQASQRLFVVAKRGGTLPVEMVASEVAVIDSGPTSGAIKSRGALVTSDGQVVADFEQTYTLPAGADYVLGELSLTHGPAWREGDHVASRLKVGQGEWRVHRGVQWTRLPVNRGRFVAGDYVELSNASSRVAVVLDRPALCRRYGDGELEWALAPGSHPHRFAIGLQTAYPLRTAFQAMAPPLQVAAQTIDGSADSGWWLHVDSANVQVSHLEVAASDMAVSDMAVSDGAASDGTAGNDDGVRVVARLIETEGRAVAARLRLCRPIRSAWLCRLSGDVVEELPVEDGVAVIEIGAYGWLQVAAAW
ncbi:MAG: hypothetical protein AAF589_01765 [Planctomycetota bacterium]